MKIPTITIRDRLDALAVRLLDDAEEAKESAQEKRVEAFRLVSTYYLGIMKAGKGIADESPGKGGFEKLKAQINGV